MENIEQEKNALQQATESSRLMADVMQKYDQENKRLWIALLVSFALLISLAFCFAYSTCKMQETMNKAVLEALETVSEMEVTANTTTTTTQTGDGETVTFNNVQGEQYNGNARKGGGE